MSDRISKSNPTQLQFSERKARGKQTADSWYSNAARSCKALIFFIFSQLSDNFYMALLKQLKFIEQCSKNSTYRV